MNVIKNVFLMSVSTLIILIISGCIFTKPYASSRKVEFGTGTEISHSKKIRLYEDSEAYYVDWVCSGENNPVLMFKKEDEPIWLSDMVPLPGNVTPVDYTDIVFSDQILFHMEFKRNGKLLVILTARLDDDRVPWIFRSKSSYYLTSSYYLGTVTADIAVLPVAVPAFVTYLACLATFKATR